MVTEEKRKIKQSKINRQTEQKAENNQVILSFFRGKSLSWSVKGVMVLKHKLAYSFGPILASR